MKSLLVLAALAAGAPAFSQDSRTYPTLTIGPGCAFATIGPDDTVSIDWSCVQTQAAEYKARRNRSTMAAFALVLDALRDGTAIAK